MRRLFVLAATGFLALGMAGAANAAVMNWSGTSTILLTDYPPGELRGGGVATINGSDGVIPAHLNTLRVAESRGQIRGTFTRFVTDPDTIANGVLALVYDGIGALTGTWGGISGGVASTSTGNIGIMPRKHVRKDPKPGDAILSIGGRTGRDGIHGATFSSLELHTESETVSSGAVQIGDPITERKVMDVVVQARDEGLFSAITDL